MLSAPEDGVPVLKTPAARRRSIVMPLLVALLVAAVVLILTGTGRPSEQLVGSGSTLAQPLVEQAARDFRDAAAADNPERRAQTGQDWVVSGAGIDYEPVGSTGGVLRLRDEAVDFAVADYPLSAEVLEERGYAQFPIVVGAIAVVHRLPLPEGQRLRLDAETLAAIYLGEITAWDDERLARINPGVTLPDLPITPVHRSDGSGSTFGLTSYLAAGSQDWAAGPGVGPDVSWPLGTAAERSSAVVEAVSSTPGAIGYAELGQSTRAGLATADLANSAGTFVAPDQESMTLAVAGADWSGSDDYTGAQVAADEPGAYPVTTAVYAVLRREDDDRTRQVLSFLGFVIDEYDGSAGGLGYLPLPADGAEAVKTYWQSTFDYPAAG